jgi:hypothetical protein
VQYHNCTTIAGFAIPALFNLLQNPRTCGETAGRTYFDRGATGAGGSTWNVPTMPPM